MKNNKYKIAIIVSILLAAIGLIMGTYAYYQTTLFNNLNVGTSTKGLDYYINYTKGQDITAGTLNPSSSYTGGLSTGVTLKKKDNTYDIYGHIYLDITTIGATMRNSNALKYTLVNGSTVISSGTLYGKTSNSSVLIKSNIPLTTTEQTYTLYLWLDENETLDNNMENEGLSAKIRCTATMKTIE